MKRLCVAALVACVLAACAAPAAFAAEKALVEGRIPAAYNQPKPTGLVGSTEYAPELGSTSGGTGGGTNRLSFAAFETGDICCAFGSPTGHAGLFDGALYHGNATDWCMRSANVAPANGVQLEQPVKYRNYDRAYGLWVPSTTKSLRYSVRDYAKAQMGEPYVLDSSKSDQTRWYCSKLVWAGYKYRAARDLDANGGYFVSPADLVNDRETYVFASSD